MALKRGRPIRPKTSPIDPGVAVTEADIITALLYKNEGYLTNFQQRRMELGFALADMDKVEETDQLRSNKAKTHKSLYFLEMQEAKIISIFHDMDRLLTMEEMTVLKLKYLEDMSDVKIAAALDKNCSAVSTLLNDGVKKLISQSSYVPDESLRQ